MSENKLNISDLLIIIFLLLCCFAGFFYASKGEQGKRVLISTPYGNYSYSLDRDRIVRVKGLLGNFEVEIKNGTVKVTETNCPKKICKRFKISRVNDSITCMPNMINIKIEGSERDGIDAITE
ncbi:MAG: NusG domain II-containing protein [Brevinematia bacterium]